MEARQIAPSEHFANFRQHRISLPDGRTIAVWSLRPLDPGAHRTPIVIGAGFARRMHSFGPMALYFALNGFNVYRYDCLNHVGLSDGEIASFRMSDALASMAAVVDWVHVRSGHDLVGLVATSLTARVAYEVASRSDRIAFLMSIVGVVHLRRTLSHVFGVDYFGMPEAELPEHAVFEDKKITGLPFVRDAIEGNWLTLDSTASILERTRCPILTFVANDDKWVDVAEVREAFGRGRGARRTILEIEDSGHDVSINAAVARSVMTRAVRAALDLAAVPASSEIAEPTFELITGHSLHEKRIQRAGASR